MIKLILLDVDGTLTDGGIYKGNSGEELKKFHVRDGYTIVYVNKYLNKKFGVGDDVDIFSSVLTLRATEAAANL